MHCGALDHAGHIGIAIGELVGVEIACNDQRHVGVAHYVEGTVPNQAGSVLLRIAGARQRGAALECLRDLCNLRCLFRTL